MIQKQLIEAIHDKNIDKIRRYLDDSRANPNGLYVDEYGSKLLPITSVFDRCYERNDEHLLPIVEILLNAGADPNKKPNECPPAIYLAVIYKCYKIVKLLLEAGANPNYTLKHGPDRFSTPLSQIEFDYKYCSNRHSDKYQMEEIIELFKKCRPTLI